MSQIDVSFVLASDDPQKLAEFYSFAMELSNPPEQTHHECWSLRGQGLTIQFYRPSTKGHWPIRGRAGALCLRKQATENPLSIINDWSHQLISQGASVIQRPIAKSFGVESWLSDPEENAFLLFAPNLLTF